MRALIAVLVQRSDVAFADDDYVGMHNVLMEDRFIMRVGELEVVLTLRK